MQPTKNKICIIVFDSVDCDLPKKAHIAKDKTLSNN